MSPGGRRRCRSRWRSCRRHPDQGAALVEFALIFPIFALMLFATIQFGTLFAGWAQLRNAVQTSARMAAMGETSPACGEDSQPACTAAVLIGAPVGLVSPTETITSLGINVPAVADCTIPTGAALPTGFAPAPTCGEYSWLDGYFIDIGGSWQQIVNSASPPGGQVQDSTAFSEGTAGGWQCTQSRTVYTSYGPPSYSYCTQISTVNATGASAPRLGDDFNDIALQCGNGASATFCPAGQQLFVCAKIPANRLTALLPDMSVSTQSVFYIETGAASTIDQAGIPCG